MYFLVADTYGYVDWAVINPFVISEDSFKRIPPYQHPPKILKKGTKEEMTDLLTEIPTILSEALEWSKK